QCILDNVLHSSPRTTLVSLSGFLALSFLSLLSCNQNKEIRRFRTGSPLQEAVRSRRSYSPELQLSVQVQHVSTQPFKDGSLSSSHDSAQRLQTSAQTLLVCGRNSDFLFLKSSLVLHIDMQSFIRAIRLGSAYLPPFF